MNTAIITNNSQTTVKQYVDNKVSINHQVNLYLDHVLLLANSKKLSMSTFKTYSSKLKIFIKWFKETPAQSSSLKLHLQEYQAYLISVYTSSKTINLLLSITRGFFKWLFQNDFIDTDPSSSLINEKDDVKTKKSWVDQEQQQLIFEYLRTAKGSTAKRNRAMIIFAISTGARVNEIANVNIEDFGVHNGKKIVMLLRKGYKTKDKSVIIDHIHDFMTDYIGDRKEGALFVSNKGAALTSDSISRIIKTVFRKVGIDSSTVTAHSLRKSFAMKILINGGTVMQVKAALNHKNISSTEIYINDYNEYKNPGALLATFDF